MFSSTDISQPEPQLYKMPAMAKDQWHSGREWRGRGRGEGREKGGKREGKGREKGGRREGEGREKGRRGKLSHHGLCVASQ